MKYNGSFKGTVSWERIQRRNSADFLRTFLTSYNKCHFPRKHTEEICFLVISAQLFAALRITKPSFGKVPEFDLKAQSLSCLCATENLISLSTQLLYSVVSLELWCTFLRMSLAKNDPVDHRLKNMWIKLRINRHFYVVCFTEQVTLSDLPWK